MNGYKDPAEETALPLLPLQADTIRCKSCRKEIPRVLHAQAKVLVCSCKRIYNNRPNELAYEGIFNTKKPQQPWIPLGSRGTLKGIKYQVVGYQVAKEKGKIYKWREYVLFNPLNGYAFLSEYDGHWNFFRYVGNLQHNPLFEKNIEYEGYHYMLFNKYKSESHFAIGEFPWDILGEQGQVWEYICPPYSLNKLVSTSEISWMQGEYLLPEELQKVFGIQTPPPTRVGTGSTEPLSMSLPAGKTGTAALVAFILLLALHIFFVSSSKEGFVFKESFPLSAGSHGNGAEPVGARTIELKPDQFGNTNMEFILQAPVQNSWFAIGVNLIHLQSGREYSFEMGVEYYSGYEGGESWSEGSKKEDKLLSSMPPGTYQMLIYPYLDSGNPIREFSLQIHKDLAVWSNFWIMSLLIWLVPFVQGIREYYFERSRWLNSNYSPYDK